METVHANGSPLAAYLEGVLCILCLEWPLSGTDAAAGEGYLESPAHDERATAAFDEHQDPSLQASLPSFAPSGPIRTSLHLAKTAFPPVYNPPTSQSTLTRIHNACSIAVNSRLGRADNARFIEHFRYIIVASQLLDEYLDQGALPPPAPGLDGAVAGSSLPSVTTSLFGAAATAAIAFALVYAVHWARNSRSVVVTKSRVILGLLLLLAAAFVGYVHLRRQWLRLVRRNAVLEVSGLTANWQAFEVSAGSALSLIQEVELVSRGYSLSAPLPPASRIEAQAASRHCARLRRSLQKAYTAAISICTGVGNTLGRLIDEDDLEKYFEVYDISPQDAKDAMDPEGSTVLGDDPQSLKSLRVLGYRAGVLRRVILCSLMSLEADGGKPDFHRWRLATEAMGSVSQVMSASTQKIQQCLGDMETISTPINPPAPKLQAPATKEKLRGQVRKISMLSSGIKTLQAKMQVLREETNRSIEQSEDLTDLGPTLLAQYDNIGADLKDLVQAWEEGKASLQTNLNKQERHISQSSGGRSVVSSLGGLTAVEEEGGPVAALKALTGGAASNRSSMGTTNSEDEVFEAVAMPRQRSSLTREERIVKMQEERERQAMLRAKRDANTSMLRELESVINLRPKNTGAARITSI